MLLTKTQLAQRAGVAESTLRTWIRRWPAYFPAVEGGRYPRYREDAIAVARTLAALMEQQLSADEVEATLRAQYPATVEAQPQDAAEQPQPLTMLSEVVSAAVREAAAAMDEGAKARDAALLEEIRALKAQLARLSATRPSWWARLWRKGNKT